MDVSDEKISHEQSDVAHLALVQESVLTEKDVVISEDKPKTPARLQKFSAAVLLQHKSNVVALLSPTSRLVFVGEIKLQVLQGCADVNGYVMEPYDRSLKSTVVSSSTVGALSSILWATTDSASPGWAVDILAHEDIQAAMCDLASKSHTAIDSLTVLRLQNFRSPLNTLISSVRMFRAIFDKHEPQKVNRVPGDGQESIPSPSSEAPASNAAIPMDVSSAAGSASDSGQTHCENFVQLETAAFFNEDDEYKKDVAFNGHTPFETPQEWQPIAERAIQLSRMANTSDTVSTANTSQPPPTGPPITPVFLVCGGRDSGKSTFARWLASRLVGSDQEVMWLDCDLGQTEFTPPGLVSLCIVTEAPTVRMAPFSHMDHAPLAAHFVGDASPGNTPLAYMQCVCDLYEQYVARCVADGRVRPLVINTQGWVKGLGLPMLLDIIRHVAPALIVQIDSSSQGRNLPDLSLGISPDISIVRGKQLASPRTYLRPFRVSENPEVVRITSTNHRQLDSRGKSLKYSAKDIRTLSWITYFGTMVGEDNTTITRSLTLQEPYAVPFDAVMVALLDTAVPVTEVFRVLNASIVGLLTRTEDSHAYTHTNRHAGTTPTYSPLGLTMVPFNPLAPCIGYGVVRAIDVTKRVLYINSPLPPSILQTVEVLAKGNLDLPQPLLHHGACGTHLYTTGAFSSADVAGGHGRKTRTNLTRKHMGGGTGGAQ